MSKKVSKTKFRQMESLIQAGEKDMERAKRNAYIFTATFTMMDFLLGFFISTLQFSYVGLENIAYVLLWVGNFFSVIATLIFTMSSLDDYYRIKNEVMRLKEEFEKMEV